MRSNKNRAKKNIKYEDNAPNSINTQTESIKSNYTNHLLNRIFIKSKKIFEEYNKLIIPTIIALIGYIFYQFGYSFLYGYYFGGSAETVNSIMDMLVNPIPFNFKTVTAFGILVLFLTIIYLISIIGYIYANRVDNKIMLFLFHVITVWLIYGVIINFYSEERKVIALLFNFFSISLMIIFLGIIIKVLIKDPFGLISIVLYIIFTIIFAEKSIGINSNIFSIGASLTIIIAEWIITFSDYLLKKGKCVKIIFKVIEFFPIFVFGWGLIRVILEKFTAHNKLFSILIEIMILILFFIFRKVGKNIKKQFKLEKARKEVTYVNKGIEFIIVFILLSFSVIGIVVIMAAMYLSVMQSGKIIRSNIRINNIKEITYTDTDGLVKHIVGNLVAQDNNTFYISEDESRKLVIIRTNNISVKSIE